MANETIMQYKEYIAPLPRVTDDADAVTTTTMLNTHCGTQPTSTPSPLPPHARRC